MKDRDSLLEIVVFDTESFAAAEIVEEGVIGLLGPRGIFLGQVHEVRTVGDYVAEEDNISKKRVFALMEIMGMIPSSIITMFSAQSSKLISVFVL